MAPIATVAWFVLERGVSPSNDDAFDESYRYSPRRIRLGKGLYSYVRVVSQRFCTAPVINPSGSAKPSTRTAKLETSFNAYFT